MYVCISTYLPIYISVYIYIYVIFMYTHTYTHTHFIGSPYFVVGVGVK